MSLINSCQKTTHSFRVICFIFLASWAAGCSTSVPVLESGERVNAVENLEKPYVILVSIDGYRYDYTDRFSPPQLKAIRDQGASAERLIPVYPSKTFTNHYSIITGLYAENHGIVANVFYDPQRKDTYRLSDRTKVQDGTWYSGTPLWVASEKQGMLSASFFWPGSEADIGGLRPRYYLKFDDKISHNARIEQVVKWLRLPKEKRPHLINLYFADVDTAGHEHGPDSQEVRDAVLKVDQALALLVEELKGIRLPVNLVIVSDHGMQKLDPQKVEYLDDYTQLGSSKVLGDGPQVLIYTENSRETDRIYRDLKKNAKHFKVFKRSEIPGSYHYGKNSRAGDLLVVTEAPYSVGTKTAKFKVGEGNHGYDPDATDSMHGIFYASGPNIRPNTTVKRFRNVHIYPFILKLLGLKPVSRIDGESQVLEPLLNHSFKQEGESFD